MVAGSKGEIFLASSGEMPRIEVCAVHSMKSTPLPLQHPAPFQQAVIAWFEREGRDYPWRRTQQPYAILVSEMMLQQTQIATVLGKRYFENWLEQFPTVEALAKADEATLLRAWEGLGYYRRARNLQRAAQVVLQEHGGVFPSSVAELERLPGVGRYTAGAVATFAFDAPQPIIDANIARVLARLCNYREEIDTSAGQAYLWDIATRLVPSQQARSYNSGLMELGQRLCTPRAPQCLLCPVRTHCAGTENDPEALPRKRPPRETVHLTEHVAWAQRTHSLLLHQEQGQRRQGLWKLPERAADYFIQHSAKLLFSTLYTITHHRVRLLVYEAPKLIPSDHESWQLLNDIPHLPMPSPYRKVVKHLTSLT